MKSFVAVITPLSSGAHPDHELPKPPAGGAPPRPDHTLPGQLPRPSHPIYYPLPPGAPPHPDQGLPPFPSQGLPPAGSAPPRPDQGLPGSQPRPDHGLPGAQPQPEHPIVLPPDTPESGGGWGPIYIWGGGPGARPPIALPPDGPAPPEVPGKIEWEAVWTPENGWQTIGVIVPDNGKPVPTPSRK